MDDLERLKELAEKATQEFHAPWEHIHGGIWCQSRKGGQTKFLDIRGWGYLTGGGHGALAISPDKAATIQDDMAEYIAAANPQTTLKLIKRLEELERENAQLENELRLAAGRITT